MHLKKRKLLVCTIPLLAIAAADRNGPFLFDQETFGGNGRTCSTCHSQASGTISPVDAQKRFVLNRRDPLFQHDATDDGNGHGLQRVLTEATILIEIPLPANVTLEDAPTARSVKLRRGIPTLLNTPSLDPVLMVDGREPNLASQARSAIRDHAQSPLIPSDADLDTIAAFEQTDTFFSSPEVRNFAHGGPAPALPEGVTDAERRGRTFFEERFDPTNFKIGSCAICHGGPMLDRTNRFFPGPATRFQSVAVSEFNEARNPVHIYLFHNADNTVTRITSPDPGRALITGNPADANQFKISPLRAIARTAPYFHDNSARNLEEAVDHYARLFAVLIPGKPIILTPQDQADIVAYLKLLN